MTQMMLPGFEKQVALAKKAKDPRIRALVEKWAPKFDALDGK